MRMAGTGEGIGRYIEEVVRWLMRIDLENQYVLIFMSGASVAKRFTDKNANFQTVFTGSKYYSWSEQIGFVRELNALKLDLIHFPSFNAPLLYRGKFVVTIHDLIHHHYPGKTKLRFFHRLAYRLAMRNAVKRAEKIIAVSEATKRDIAAHYGVDSSKLQVVYEGVSERFRESASPEEAARVKKKYGIGKPYILFVGAWRRYKNVPLLARIFDIIRDRHHRDWELVLTGNEDAYYPQVKREVFAIKNKNYIRALGFVPDDDLGALYQGAAVFVLPSGFEGFGLIAVEAQASGTAVVASDISVLREVLADGAEYFEPDKIEEAAEKIVASAGKADLIRKGKANAARFDWASTAAQTLKIYKQFYENE